MNCDPRNSVTYSARAIVIWFVLLVFAVLNGVVRETVIALWMDDEAAHAVSTVILCVAVLAVALLTIRWIGPNGRRDAVLVGVVWLVLTIAFEFLAGHFLFGASWETLLGDYNIFRGRIWILVLVANLLAPVWAYSRRPG